MEAITLSTATVDAVRATKNDARQRSTAADVAAAHWSGLPQDLLLQMRALCLLYACHEYGPKEAALYCLSTNASFRVPVPRPTAREAGLRLLVPRLGVRCR